MAVNSIVIVREVWDTRDLVAQVLDDAGSLKPGAMETRFEPEDLNALEIALRLKDALGGLVTAVALGEPRSVDVLREALYRGADKVLRVAADPAALDDAATAAALASAIRGAGAYDLVLVGTNLVDGENALLGAHLAAALGVEQISWVDAVEEASTGRVIGKRAIEMGYESVEVPFPALLAVGVALLEDDPRSPRSAKAMLKLKMKKAEIPVCTPETAAAATTKTVRREAVAPRVIESREVDPESESALKTMLDECLKGE